MSTFLLMRRPALQRSTSLILYLTSLLIVSLFTSAAKATTPNDPPPPVQTRNFQSINPAQLPSFFYMRGITTEEIPAQIECPAAVPPQASFPISRGREIYSTTEALCSFFGLYWRNGLLSIPLNVGCVCKSSGYSSEVHCYPPPYSDPLLHGWSPIRTFCQDTCFCKIRPKLEADEIRGNPKEIWRTTSGSLIVYVDGPDTIAVGKTKNHELRTVTLLSSEPTTAANQRSKKLKTAEVDETCELSSNRRVVRCPGCATTCTRPGDCSKEGVGRCRCVASRQTYGGQKRWSGHCGIPIGGRKRDVTELQSACACNSSYISHQCCESENGAVWEDTTMRMGSL